MFCDLETQSNKPRERVPAAYSMDNIYCADYLFDRRELECHNKMGALPAVASAVFGDINIE